MRRATRKFQVAELGRSKIYKFYLNYLKERKLENNIVNPKMYSNVLNNFNKEIGRKLIEESFDFIMPMNIGQLRIRKYKPKYFFDSDGKLKKNSKMSINWELSKKYHKRVYHTNQHTDGYKYSFHYSNYRCILPGRSFYKFIPCRTLKRTLAKTIKNPDFRGDFYS